MSLTDLPAVGELLLDVKTRLAHAKNRVIESMRGPFPRVLHNGDISGIGGPMVKLARMQAYFPNTPLDYNIIYGSWGSIPASVCREAQARGVKVVFHVNSVFHPAYGDNTIDINAASAEIHALADYVVYGSHYAKQGAERYLHSAQAPSSIIYNALDTSHFCPTEVADPNRFNILAAGVQYIRHRLVPLIRAMPYIQQVYPNARLMIAGPLQAGDGIYDCGQESIQRVIDEVGLSEVTFLGEYAQAEAPEIYAQGDVLVHLKHMDWTPNTVAEAMACGLPVVHAGNGGMSELVRDAGVSLDLPFDWEKIHTPEVSVLAERIMTAYRRRGELGAIARKIATEHYDIRTWVEKHQQIFERLLAERRSSATARSTPY